MCSVFLLPCLIFSALSFPSGSVVKKKNQPAIQELQEMLFQSLGREDPLEEGMATHSSILIWRTPWTEEPSGLQSMGSQRGTHTLLFLEVERMNEKKISLVLFLKSFLKTKYLFLTLSHTYRQITKIIKSSFTKIIKRVPMDPHPSFHYVQTADVLLLRNQY